MARTVKANATTRSAPQSVSSDDEFGEMNMPDTPKNDMPPKAKQPVAGPSKPAAKAASAPRKRAANVRATGEPDPIISKIPEDMEDDEEGVVELASPPEPPPKNSKKPPAKGKGKVAPRPPPVHANRKNGAVPEIVTVVEDDEEEDVLEPPKKRMRTDTDWQKLLDKITRERDAAVASSASIVQRMGSGAEGSKTGHHGAYTEQLATQQELINSLKAQIARMDALTEVGRTTSANFMTRERSDARMAQAEAKVRDRDNKIRALQENLAAREADIIAKDNEISILQSDLKVEIENSKQTIQRVQQMNKGVNIPQSRLWSSTTASPKRELGQKPTQNSMIICLYEGLCGIDVPNMVIKPTPKAPDMEEVTYTCVVHLNERALSFTLRTVYEPTGDPAEPWAEYVIYAPQGLANESEDFVQSLSYLGQSFRFTRDQLGKFYTNIRELLEQDLVEDEQGMEGDSREEEGMHNGTGVAG